jgi:hypothetical protein
LTQPNAAGLVAVAGAGGLGSAAVIKRMGLSQV